MSNPSVIDLTEEHEELKGGSDAPRGPPAPPAPVVRLGRARLARPVPPRAKRPSQIGPAQPSCPAGHIPTVVIEAEVASTSTDDSVVCVQCTKLVAEARRVAHSRLGSITGISYHSGTLLVACRCSKGHSWSCAAALAASDWCLGCSGGSGNKESATGSWFHRGGSASSSSIPKQRGFDDSFLSPYTSDAARMRAQLALFAQARARLASKVKTQIAHQVVPPFLRDPATAPFTDAERVAAMDMLLARSDPFDRLCVPRPRASEGLSDIRTLARRHYKLLALLVHPDKAPPTSADSRTRASNAFKALRTAFEAVVNE